MFPAFSAQTLELTISTLLENVPAIFRPVSHVGA
jgi:hypothetical protein